MKTVVVMTTIVVVMVMVLGTVEGGWRRRWRRQRRCHRAAGHGVMEVGEGDHFQWSMTGLDQDDLRVTYHAGSFAPEGSPVVFLYPRDRGQRALDLVPAKMFYDFSDPQNPVIVIRKARRGRGMCVVLTKSADVNSRDDMLTQLLDRNMTNREVVEEEEARRLAVEETSDPSQFSGILRDLCSQDLCGNPVDTVYFTAREEDVTEDEEELLEEAEEMDAMFDRSFMLFNDRVTIAGLPTRRQWRQRHHMMGPMGPMMDRSRQQRRQQRRQRRLQQRLQRRQQWRRERRQRRHQGREVVQTD